MRAFPAAIIAGAFIAFSLAPADNKPDFSGVWKLNIEKSDFGKAPAPKSLTSRIEQKGPEIAVHSEIEGPQGTYSTDYRWIADGRENVNTLHGNEIKTTVVWNGDALEARSRTVIQGVSLTIADVWTLSDRGCTLTVGRTIEQTQGKAAQTLVYEKTRARL